MVLNFLTLQLNTNLEKQFPLCKSSLCVFRRLNSSGSFIPKVYWGGCLKCLDFSSLVLFPFLMTFSP